MLRLGVLLTLLVMAGCDMQFTNPVEDAKLILNFATAPTSVSGQFIDASTGRVIQDRDLHIRFLGPDAERVLDVSGTRMTETVLEDFGGLTFNVDGDVPTSSNPFDIRLEVQAEGYVTTNKPLRLVREDSDFEISLVRLDDTPEGVTAAEEVGAESDASGAVAADHEVATAPDPQTGASTSVAVQKGTVLRSASGEPLQGRLKTTVVHFSGASNAARAAFPGGLLGANIEADEDGQARRATFQPIGFTSVEVRDDRGREARTFDRPMTIGMSVPSGTMNPETGAAVEAGDVIPVYSFETDAGAWHFEGRYPVEGADGGLAVRFPTQHLTYFNLGWSADNVCETESRIELVSSDAGECTAVDTWELTVEETGELLASGGVSTGYFQLDDAPKDVPVLVEFFDGDQSVAQERIGDMCAYDGSLTVPPAADDQLVSIDFDVTLGCNEPPVDVRPSIAIQYRAVQTDETGTVIGYPNGERFVTARMKDGSFRLSCMEKHTSYEFVIYYEGEEYRRIFNVARDENSDSITVDGVVYSFKEYGVTIKRVSDVEYEISIDYTLKEGESSGFCDA